MSAGNEYPSELILSGDMYVTVPRNVWHCNTFTNSQLQSLVVSHLFVWSMKVPGMP
jgi:hypothetical protein